MLLNHAAQVHELEAQKRALQKSDSVKAVSLQQVAMAESDALLELQELRQHLAAQSAACAELRLQLQQLQAQHQQQAHSLQQQAQQDQQAQHSPQLQPWQRQHAHAKLMHTLEQQQQQLKEYQQVLASERKAYAELLARSPPPKPPVGLARPGGLLRRSTSSNAAIGEAITNIGAAARAAAMRKIASMRQPSSSNLSSPYIFHQ